MLEIAQIIWNFILDHFWALVGIAIIIRYGKSFYKKYIFDPLAGGNGKIQMDELAKGIVIAILIWVVQRDGYRTHDWAYFSDAVYAALIAGLFAIAAIKPVASVLRLNKNKTKQDEPEKGPGHSDTSDPNSV